MAPVRFNSLAILEKNSADIYLESTGILITIAKNVLREPSNPKYRSLSLKSNVMTKKLLPANGAMECLFDMGFQKVEDNLILSQQAPLDTIRYIQDELIKRREQKDLSIDKKPLQSFEKKISFKNEIRASKISSDLVALQNETVNSFLKKVVFWCFRILQYENYELQKKALNLVPLTELNLNVIKNIRKIQLEYKKKNISGEIIDFQELLLIELCNWFNTEFFTWVDTPQCTKCGFIETVHDGMSYEVIPGADRVEKYKCQKCNETVLFPRYNDPDKLLETRKGRCGEWANSFCSICKALGWDTRLVFDETDHVWTEVYSIVKSRWIHCDPCENAVDTPLMYECGWKKKLSYVIAYSIDEIQDVTWRYSINHAQVLKTRNKCSESELVDFIIKVRNTMLNHASEARKKFVLQRTALELVDLMKQNSSSQSEEKGRISGSLAWRLLRGETSVDIFNFEPYVWRIDHKDEENKKFGLSYITSKDMYLKNSECVLKNWKAGMYKVQSVFKKDEKDWKMSYLARQENAERGLVAWKFEANNKFSIGTVQLKLVCQTYETGMISSKLCSNDSCIVIPNNKDTFVTDAFTGSRSIELTVELYGGNFWQHAQILRQSFTSEEPTFEILINLVKN